jgi:aspartyl-tRNA(Asn)/glutamyl-tRNA(Gln) amidotransferase subunit A
MKTLRDLAAALADGSVTARGLVEQSLERIADPAGEGARAFISIAAIRALAEADQHDAARKAGRAVSPFAGIPYGVKDLYDVAGEVTAAGSKFLRFAPAAAHDSEAVWRLRAQGFIPIGRTNMTEFAYSGVGLNPHYGTPLSIYDRGNKRIPGGSSAGTAVAIAEGMVSFGLGTDTGGSCRIPAAFNGIVGYKPTASTVSKRGVYPLSASFDSVGPLAKSVACCATLHAFLSGQANVVAKPSRPLRVGVLQTTVQDGLDRAVAADFDRALESLKRVGVDVVSFSFAPLERMPEYLVNGGIVAAEGWAHHHAMIAADENLYDPRVASRLRFGARSSADDIARFMQGRKDMIAEFAKVAPAFDAVICPTVSVVPPKISELDVEDDYRRINAVCLRNTYAFNFLDCCSISLPMNRAGEAPTGLMLSQVGGQDSALLAVAEHVEQILAN